MYAIVDIGGKQFKVSKDEKILAPRLEGTVGSSVELDRVLLVSNKGKVTVGQPHVPGARVKAEILGYERGEKVIVFKKKRRKGYQVKKGHRQGYTSLLIKNIQMKTASKKSGGETDDGA